MSVKKNFVYNFAYQILVMILPLITTPYIARVIGPEGIGIQSYTYSIVNYFAIFAMMGINNYGNRSIAMVRDHKSKLNKMFTSIYSIQVIMSILMMMLYLIYIIFFVRENRIIFIIQAIYLISVSLDINWFFFGMEKFKLTVVRNTIIKMISVISIFVFVKESKDLYLYAFILAFGNLASQLVLWMYLKEYVKFSKVTKREIYLNLKPILILFIPVISVSVYKVMDKIMLGAMSNMVQVGFYENSEKIVSIPMGIAISLGTVMLPKMSNLYATGNEKEGIRYIGISLDFIMFMSFGAMFGLIAVSPILIPIFLGVEFTACIGVISLLAITILFISWANVIRTQFLIPKNKDIIYISSTIGGAIINLITNFLLIKRYGAIGAAIGTIFAEAFVCIFQTFMVRKELNIVKYLKKTSFYIIPGIIMYGVVVIIGNKMGLSLRTGVIQVIVGIALYTSISLIYMISRKSEIIMNMINMISRKCKKLGNEG